METKFYNVTLIIDVEAVTPKEGYLELQRFFGGVCHRIFHKDLGMRCDVLPRELDESKGEFELIIPMYMESPHKEDVEFQTKVIVDTQLHNEKACNRIKSYHIKDVSAEEITGEYYDALLRNRDTMVETWRFMGLLGKIEE